MTGFASRVTVAIVAVWAASAARGVLGGGKRMPDGEAKMFAASAEYDRFMGRWSRLLAPELIAFAGVKDNVLTLSRERRRQLAARLRKRILDGRTDGPFVLQARAWCVTGEVPKP